MKESADKGLDRPKAGRVEKVPVTGMDDFEKGLVALEQEHMKRAMKLTDGNRDEAKDLVQETLAKALRNKAQFETGTNLAAWTDRILKNTYTDWLRRDSHTKTLVGEEDVEAIIENTASPGNIETTLDSRRLLDETLKNIANLAPHQRQALTLMTKGDTGEEAAAKLHINRNTVKTHVHRAREALRSKLPRRGRLNDNL